MKILRYFKASPITLIVFFSFVSYIGYIVYSYFFYKIGFPLDDSWIHQAFARNFIRFGEWSLVHGYPVAGSTAPLWTLLLSPAYLLSLNPFLWTFFLGFLIHTLSAIVAQDIFSLLIYPQKMNLPLVGIFFAVEWHLVWASASGMETALFCLMILLVVKFFLIDRKNSILTGCLIGVSIWLRPEGITLLGPVLLTLFFCKDERRNIPRNMLIIFCPVLLSLLIYFLFNYSISGMIFPTTFSAKYAEYQVLTQVSMASRLSRLLLQPLIGASVLLLPGIMFQVVEYVRTKQWAKISIVLWILSFIFLYANRLPVTYQHGRYLIPIMPPLFLIGFEGTLHWISFLRENIKGYVVFGFSTCFIMVTMIFWFLGARAYAEDVAIIESEMVATGKWISENLPEDTLIAVHDIGAVSYFGQRNMIDLAGLASPEVIPIIRNEMKLKQYLDDREVQYLVTFPGWYRELTMDLPVIFTTQGQFSPAAGGENMTIYKWGSR